MMGRIVKSKHANQEDFAGEVVAYNLTQSGCSLLILKSDGTLVRADSEWVVVVQDEPQAKAPYVPPPPTSAPPPTEKRGSLLKKKA